MANEERQSWSLWRTVADDCRYWLVCSTRLEFLVL